MQAVIDEIIARLVDSDLTPRDLRLALEIIEDVVNNFNHSKEE